MKTFNTYKVAQEGAGLNVEGYLRQILQYSGRKIQKLTRSKGIFLNGKQAYLQRPLKPGDTLRVIVLEDTSFGVEPEAGDITVLYEDQYLIVLNKPAYLLVHPTGQTSSGTLANYLAHHLKVRGILSTIRPVHRLDRDTSGCVIFAKNSHSQTLLEEQLKTRVLKRSYQAFVQGIINPPEGTITAPIGPHHSHPNRRAVSEKGEQAITHYQTLATFKNTSLLKLNLETGRTHQIRVHLAHIGFPIIGDRMYGVRSPYISRQALHADEVVFRHLKDDQMVTVQAPLAADFTRAIEAIKNEVVD